MKLKLTDLKKEVIIDLNSKKVIIKDEKTAFSYDIEKIDFYLSLNEIMTVDFKERTLSFEEDEVYCNLRFLD